MDKILFKISKNNLSVSTFKKDNLEEDLNNTNIINTKEVYFSSDYIKENLELVSSFLNVVIIKQNVSKATIKDFSIVPSILDIIALIPSIKEICIKPDKIITYEIFLKLLDNKNITKIEAFDIPPYLLERLDVNRKLDVILRCEILFISNFMESNNLLTYSDIYYKKNIIINKKFDKNDLNDLITFLSINKYLKTIEFTYYDKDIFKALTDKLFELDITNIKIIFNEEFINVNSIFKEINTFKEKNENKLKRNNITLKINYSETYKRNNIFKQLNLNFVKGILVTIIIAVSLMMSINIYRNFRDNKKEENIMSDIDNILNKEIIAKNNEDSNINNYVEYISPNSSDIKIINATTTTIYDIKYKMIFEELLGINPDTVGWLKVNNTNIDYPVVLGKDNDYYLKRDFYKNSNRHGWVFLDYRNSVDHLSRNSIIYAHNLANQKMFGTLRYVLNSSWYKKASNQIITFNSINENMKFQIFSIYKVPVTSDYLLTDFPSNEAYLDFIKMIKGRSIYDFNIEVDENDKILTLSTCSNGHDQRLVVHAKLITE